MCYYVIFITSDTICVIMLYLSLRILYVLLCYIYHFGYYMCYYVICITSDTIYVVLFSESKRRHSMSDEHTNSKSVELYRHR